MLSNTGKLVESIEDGQGGQFLATAFVKARGQSPWRMGWTPAIFAAYGKLLGNMHALAARYQPADLAWKRPEWDDELMDFVGNFLPASEKVVRKKYDALCDHLYTLPKEHDSYGLIHQDAHGSNFLVDDAGKLTLFDFDDCVYSWYINDIAIALFYTVMDFEDAPAFTREFMTHFLKGYQQVYPLDPKWLQEIPYFLKLREIELYAVMHRDFDVDNIDNEWCARFMRNRKARIEQDVPFIDFYFESLYGL
jgi:Ser/Thr protein kinase RdoA (MazF antagonist)